MDRRTFLASVIAVPLSGVVHRKTPGHVVYAETYIRLDTKALDAATVARWFNVPVRLLGQAASVRD